MLPARGLRAGGASGRNGRRIWTVRAALVLAALALSGCETTAGREREDRREGQARTGGASDARAQGSVDRAREHPSQVLGATVVRDSESAAAAVTVSNSHLTHAVLGADRDHGQERTRADPLSEQRPRPGSGAHADLLAARPRTVTWVDDQVPPPASRRASARSSAKPPPGSGPEPRIEVEGLRLGEASTGEISGTVRNRSNVTQQHLIVYVLARRAGRIVAAGRAVLAEVAPGASVPFQAFLVGAPHGAKLQASAPASDVRLRVALWQPVSAGAA